MTLKVCISSPQPFWHQEPHSRKTIFLRTGIGERGWFRDESSALHLLCTLFLLLYQLHLRSGIRFQMLGTAGVDDTTLLTFPTSSFTALSYSPCSGYNDCAASWPHLPSFYFNTFTTAVPSAQKVTWISSRQFLLIYQRPQHQGCHLGDLSWSSTWKVLTPS